MRRKFRICRPTLERFEARELPSASPLAAYPINHRNILVQERHPHPFLTHHQESAATLALHGGSPRTSAPAGYLIYRITNPINFNVGLRPPFGQVLVQHRQPIPGQVYNVLYVAVKNGTAQTFTAGSGFTVRLTNQPRSFAGFPVLTGDQVWKPNQWIVFYVLTKKYYSVSFVAGGFQLQTAGRSSTLVPGPSGVFLRLPYKPATFARTLDWIVAYGQGAQLGAGAKLGLPDTAINLLVNANTNRIDFAGHF